MLVIGINQTQKDKYYKTLLRWNIYTWQMSIFTTQMAWEFRAKKLCRILWMWETLKFVIVPPIMLNMFSTIKTFSERQSRVLPNVHICTCNRAFQHWRSLALAELNRVRIISINSVSTYFEHIFHQQIKKLKI